MKNIKSQAGYTIVELMIATLIFSGVMLLCSVAIIHVGRMYYKGTITSRTQDASRRVGDDVARAIQFGIGADSPGFMRTNTAVYGGVTVYSRCIGEIRYSYATNAAKGVESLYVLYKDRVDVDDAVCLPLNINSANPGPNGQELLGDNMRIPVFDVNPTGGAANTTTIDIRIAYGDTADLFLPAPPFQICRGVNASGQFCATATYNTLVTTRL